MLIARAVPDSHVWGENIGGVQARMGGGHRWSSWSSRSSRSSRGSLSRWCTGRIMSTIQATLLARTQRPETKEHEMRSPQNTATTPARSWFDRGRLVGAAAIAFAVSVVIENAVFAGTGAQ